MKNKNDTTAGELSDVPNEKYAKFFSTFNEIDSLPVSEWKPSHLLGYFCQKYKQHYQTDYKFKYNNPAPSKSFEVFQVKKLAQMLSSNPSILKEYIDWVYQNKVVKAKRKLTSISFMTVEGVVNEYKTKYLFSPNQNISRSTPLPEKYQNVFKNFQASTYGDIAFLSQLDQPQVKQAFQQAEMLGLDISLLSRIV